MQELAAALAASDIAQYLRHGRWSYALVNAPHIIGIALLLGAVAVLDIRLLGGWRAIPLAHLARPLAAMAAAGLALATIAGLLLFAVRAPEYMAMPIFAAKLALIAIGTLSAIGHHIAHGRLLERASPAALRLAGATSILCWTGALLLGRSLAFLGG